MRRSPPLTVHALLAVFSACSGSSRSEALATTSLPLLITAGATVVAPVSPTPAVDPREIWPFFESAVVAVYELTSPPDEELAFGVVTWSRGVAITHLRDGGALVEADGLSLARAGLLPLGNGLRWHSGATHSFGDLPAPLTIQGRITRDQVFGLWRQGPGGSQAVIIRLRLGPRSAINRAQDTAGASPGVVSLDTMYTSDSRHFGMPSVATAGDRTTVVCYEGERPTGNPRRRYELRLQRDARTGAVIGGGTAENALESGGSLDHDVIARGDVLAFLRAEPQGVRVRLSFDGGTTSAQQELLVLGVTRTRLVQAAFGPGWRVAVACWRETDGGGGLELVVVEGQPAAFDGAGRPSWFVFWQTDALFSVPSTGFGPVPLRPSLAWSEAGDLVVGYGVNAPHQDPSQPWTCESQLRCAVRLAGGQWSDREVQRLPILAHGPAVAVAGHGSALRIVYGHEADDGVRLVTSDDAGATFAPGTTVGAVGDREPTLFMRETGGQTRVDVLYLAARSNGVELHRSTWLDWPAGERNDTALTLAQRHVVPAGPVLPTGMPPVSFGFRVAQLHASGYDAVQDGDHLVVAYDEVTSHSAEVCFVLTTIPSPFSTTFYVPQPPPLATGLTLTMPTPEAAHSHQLKLLRLP